MTGHHNLETVTFPGAGPPVVLLHGAGGNHHTLAPLAEAISKGGQASQVLSLPGRLGSSAIAGHDVGTLSELIGAYLARMWPDGAVLAGHSFGGAITLEVALRHPASLRGIVLMATGARLRVHPRILAAAEQAAEENTPFPVDLILPSEIDAATRERIHRTDALTPSSTTRLDWMAADRFDRLGQIDDCAVRTLVISGNTDVLTPPRYAAYLAEHLPQAQLVKFAERGHWLPMESPDAVARPILEFVQSA